MSIEINNSPVKNLNNKKEAFVLRQIFDLVKLKKESNEIEIEKIDNSLNEKYNIRNLELSNLKDIEIRQKNQYKAKLHKLLFKKKM